MSILQTYSGAEAIRQIFYRRLMAAFIPLFLGLPSARGAIQIEYPRYWAGEATEFVVIAVVRGADEQAEASVDYATVPQTATAGADYTEAQGTVSFNAGEQLKLLSIPILNDGLKEPNETFRLILSNAIGGVLDSRASATVTITDNDPGVEFVSNQLWVHEDQEWLELKVLRGNDSALGPFTVEYSLIDLSARFGMDHVPTEPGLSYEPDGTVSRTGLCGFEEGEMGRSIWVSVVNDRVLEPDERFRVRLSNPSGGVVLGRSTNLTVTVTIVDATGMAPQRFNGIEKMLEGSLQLELAASVSQRFRPFYSIFQVESSADFKSWEGMGLTWHPNSSTNPPTLSIPAGTGDTGKFFRLIATPLISADPPPTGPFAVGVARRFIVDPMRRNRYGLSTNPRLPPPFGIQRSRCRDAFPYPHWNCMWAHPLRNIKYLTQVGWIE